MLCDVCVCVCAQYSFEDLLNLVQASEAELRDGLRSLQACLIEGMWSD